MLKHRMHAETSHAETSMPWPLVCWLQLGLALIVQPKANLYCSTILVAGIDTCLAWGRFNTCLACDRLPPA